MYPSYYIPGWVDYSLKPPAVVGKRSKSKKIQTQNYLGLFMHIFGNFGTCCKSLNVITANYHPIFPIVAYVLIAK